MASVLEAIESGTVTATGEVSGFATHNDAPAVKSVPVTEIFPIRSTTDGGHIVEFNPNVRPDAFPGALVCVADHAVGPVQTGDQRKYNGNARSELSVPVVVVVMTAVQTPEDAAIAGKARRDCWDLAERVLLRLMKFQPTVGVPNYASTEPFGAGTMESETIDQTTHVVVILFNAKYAIAT